MNRGIAVLIGAILSCRGRRWCCRCSASSGPRREVRTLLKWEGVLVDPVGAMLGVLVFLGVQSAQCGGTRWHPGELFVSIGVGVLVGVAGALALWSVLREVRARRAASWRSPRRWWWWSARSSPPT